MRKPLKKFFASLCSSTLLITPFSSFAEEVSTATSDLGYFVSSELLGNGDKQVHLYKLKSNFYYLTLIVLDGTGLASSFFGISTIKIPLL